jgi:polar amino acid transport system substrate-binding protein
VKRWIVCLLVLGASLGAAPASAQTGLDQIKAGGALVWGADQEGGGPFVYPRDDDKSRITGFEVELAEKLAAALGVKAQFQQGPWDQMPSMLEARKVHIVLNGYEWTPARAEAMAATIPYYVYGLQLLARTDDGTITSFEDLRKPGSRGKRRVGILSGSAADDYMKEHFAKDVEIVSYDGNTDSMRDVEIGRLDATLQDTPIVAYYAPKFPKLKKVGAPVGGGTYVIFARKGEAALVTALNAALIRLYRDRTLERIYRSYGIWDEAQAELKAIVETGKFYGYSKEVTADVKPATPGTPASTEPKTTAIPGFLDSILILIQSAGMTVILSVISFPLAMALGLAIALGRLYGPNWLRPALVVYVEFMRGTPLMLQLYFIFFFLPVVGVNVPAFWTGIIGLAMNYAAYEAEIYRAGLQAVPKGQMEAGLALGMSRWKALRLCIVPQAVRIVIPPVINDFIALFKDTSVVSVITLVELTKQFSILSRSDPAQIAWLMAVTAVLYILMSYPTSLAARHVEKRLLAPPGAGARVHVTP